MNLTEKAHVRSVILEKITELKMVVDSDAKAQEQIELDQTRVGRLARMDAVQHHAIAQAQGARAMKQLKLLELLLSKLEDEDFGECHSCGDDIPVGRLLIRPESLRCVECAE